jgi:hypothetical protein
MQAVDHRNTARMKELVEKHGWPTWSMVADDGTRCAWLLVQHGDHAPAFQRKCLELMRPYKKNDEVFLIDLAYLTDRVLVNEGREQVYGTQFHVADGKQQPRPIRDAENVDKRRKAVGMSTLKEYTETIHT